MLMIWFSTLMQMFLLKLKMASDQSWTKNCSLVDSEQNHGQQHSTWALLSSIPPPIFLGSNYSQLLSWACFTWSQDSKDTCILLHFIDHVKINFAWAKTTLLLEQSTYTLLSCLTRLTEWLLPITIIMAMMILLSHSHQPGRRVSVLTMLMATIVMMMLLSYLTNRMSIPNNDDLYMMPMRSLSVNLMFGHTLNAESPVTTRNRL